MQQQQQQQRRPSAGGSGSEAEEARPHPYLTEGRGGDDSGGEGGDPVRATISAMAARLVKDSLEVSIGSLAGDPFDSRVSSANPPPGASGRNKGSRGGSRPGSRSQSRQGSPRSSRLTDDERLTRISFQRGQSQYMSVADSQYAGGAVVGADLVQASLLERSIASGGTLHNSKSLSNLPPHLQSQSTAIATHSATTQFSLTQALPPIRLQQGTLTLYLYRHSPPLSPVNTYTPPPLTSSLSASACCNQSNKKPTNEKCSPGRVSTSHWGAPRPAA